MPADILNPVRYRTDFLKEHAESTDSYLKELLDKTDTSLSENQADCREINALDKVLKKTKRRFTLFKLAFGLLLALLSVVLLVSIASAYYVFTETDLALSPAARYSVFASCIVAGVLFIALIVLTSIFLSRKNKKFRAEILNFQEKIDGKIHETFAKLQNFYRSFDYNFIYTQMQRQIPEIEFLKSADTNFVKYIETNFDQAYAPSSSAMPVSYKAGYFYKNPFIVAMYKQMEMVPHTYTGSLSISYYTGYGQNRRLVSEVLHATLVKPKPEYKYFALNSLFSKAVPELDFFKTTLDGYNPAKHDKFISQAEKTLAKLEKTNPDFTPMANSEFEALFPVSNRSSEQKYRAFFGQVAQQTLVNFAKELTTGRDYSYSKEHTTNEIHTPDLTANFAVSPFDFVDYNLTKFLTEFTAYSKALSRALYDSFIPYLANPVLFEGNISKQPAYEGKASIFEHLALLDKLPNAYLLPNDAGIDDYIIEPLSEYEQVCRVHSFKTVPRLDYVVVMGGDGPHQVPVHWTEYIPVFRELTYSVEKVDSESNYFENSYFDKDNQAFTEENTVSIV